MVKPSFSLTEQAIEKLAKCVHGAPIKEIKLVRLLHSVASVLDNDFSQSLKPLFIIALANDFPAFHEQLSA